VEKETLNQRIRGDIKSRDRGRAVNEEGGNGRTVRKPRQETSHRRCSNLSLDCLGGVKLSEKGKSELRCVFGGDGESVKEEEKNEGQTPNKCKRRLIIL